MEDINNVTLVCRLVKDAELKYTNSGTPVTKLSVASNRSVKKNNQWEDEASFFDCTFWGKRGESLNQYLTKGQQVCISGSLKQERWESEGQQRSRVIIHVDNIQLLGGKSTNSQSNNVNNQGYNNGSNGFNGGNGNNQSNNGQQTFEDDIPF